MSTATPSRAPATTVDTPVSGWLALATGMLLGAFGWLLTLGIWHYTNWSSRFAEYDLLLVPGPWLVVAGVVWLAHRSRWAELLLVGGLLGAAITPMVAWLVFIAFWVAGH